MNKDSVTISLESYNEMQRELTRLRKEVEEKTIIKESIPMGIKALIAAIVFATLFIVYHFQ